jgi:DNA-binding XRE family transcriptional regulator
MLTAIPPTSSSGSSSHSPVCRPARISSARSATRSRIASALLIARVGPSNTASAPSPSDFTNSQLIEGRRKGKLSQRELAKLSGVPQSEISRIETGASNPMYATITALLRPLGKRIQLPGIR